LRGWGHDEEDVEPLFAWIDFLDQVESWFEPTTERVYAVVDNLNIHSGMDVLLFALAHPRREFVFQPTPASWPSACAGSSSATAAGSRSTRRGPGCGGGGGSCSGPSTSCSAPPAATAAFSHGQVGEREERRIEVDGREVAYVDLMAWSTLATPPGLPATVVPIDLSGQGLPVGVQVIGPRLEDRTPLAFAALLERAFGSFSPPRGATG